MLWMIRRARGLMASERILAMGVLLVGMYASPSWSSTFTAEAVACGGYDYQPVSAGIALASTGYHFSCLFGSYGRATGIASAYGVGAYSELVQITQGSASIVAGRGRVDTEVIFSGPASVAGIPVAINFHVDGGFGGGLAADQSSYRWIDLTLNMYTSYFYGRVGERVSGAGGTQPVLEGALAPTGTACLPQGCLIKSPIVYVPVNTPVYFAMQLQANVEHGNGVGYASFENTFYFPLNVDVFDLPDGYTADMADLNVVNNRVVLPNTSGEVPEPGTYGLVGLGLAAVLLRRR